MKLRYIQLKAKFGDFDDEFFYRFIDNTRFISDYLSRKIRTINYETEMNYNMVNVEISRIEDQCKIVESEKALTVNIHFSNDELEHYSIMYNEKTRFNYYLHLLEKGYHTAIQNGYLLPKSYLFQIHTEFRNNKYLNERLFKKALIRKAGVKIGLFHVLSSYSYRLVLRLYSLTGTLISEGCIYETFPDSILYGRTVRHVTINDDKLIITDFLKRPQFICDIKDLSKGIIKSICVNDNTRKYMPNDDNRAEFTRLKWQNFQE